MAIYENSYQGWHIYITATGHPEGINKRNPSPLGGDGLGFGGLRGAWAGKLFIYFELAFAAPSSSSAAGSTSLERLIAILILRACRAPRSYGSAEAMLNPSRVALRCRSPHALRPNGCLPKRSCGRRPS